MEAVCREPVSRKFPNKQGIYREMDDVVAPQAAQKPINLPVSSTSARNLPFRNREFLAAIREDTLGYQGISSKWGCSAAA